MPRQLLARRLFTLLVVILVGASLGVPSAAVAQDAAVTGDVEAAALTDLRKRLELGDTIFITDRHGRSVNGQIAHVSGTSLVVAANGYEHEVPLVTIGRIDKEGDPVSDGAWKGLAIGAPFWLIAAGFICSESGLGGCVLGTLGAATIYGAGPGALVDLAHKGRARAYTAGAGSARGRATSFSQLWTKVTSGDTIYVTDVQDRRATGAFQSTSDSSLTLLVDGHLREFAETDVGRLERRGDSVWNGALIGATIGAMALVQAASCGGPNREYCTSDRASTRVVAGTVGGVFYGLLGAGIDALVVGRTTIYEPTQRRSVRVTPMVTRDRRGVMVSVGF